MTELQLHKARKGSKNYRPGHGGFFNWLPRPVVKGFELDFVLPARSWIDPAKGGPLGNDGGDWLKLGGFAYLDPLRPGTWKKNHSAALIAFRYDPEPGWYQVCAYTNDVGGGRTTSEAQRIKGDEGGRALVVVDRFSVDYTILTPGVTMTETHAFRRWVLCVPAGPWHGGSVPAPQPVELFANLKRTK